MNHVATPFEQIRRTNPTGNEYWSSRDFARVLGYVNYRHFMAVVQKAQMACFNSGQRTEDHFVGVDEMVDIGSGAQRPVKTVMMSRYACYLVIQNADPAKAIVAIGQTYFAIQTRRQELSDQEVEEYRRLQLRAELKQHNTHLADAASGRPKPTPLIGKWVQKFGRRSRNSAARCRRNCRPQRASSDWNQSLERHWQRRTLADRIAVADSPLHHAGHHHATDVPKHEHDEYLTP